MISSPDRVVSRHIWTGMLAALMSAAGLLWLAGVGLTGQAEQPRGTAKVSATENPNADKSADTPQPAPPGRSAADAREARPAAVAPLVEYIEFPRPTKLEKKIREALDKPTRVDFAGTPVEKCIAELSDIHNISIIMDLSKIREEGVVLEQPITLRAAGLSLRSILKLLLEPVGLAYHIENDLLKITISNGCGRTVLRMYPVGDLHVGAQNDTARYPGDLEQAITKHVYPDSWEQLSGPGSMSYIHGARTMAISQDPYVHEQILDFLRGLREAKQAHEVPSAAKQAIRQPAWRSRGPQRDEAYALAGLIELDGDPNMDRARLHDVVSSAGGRIDNEIRDDGALFVDGKREDRPQLSEITKYVVIGKIPQPANLSHPDQIAAALRTAGRLADLEDAARDHGVPIVSLQEFLKYLDYGPSE